MKLDRVVMTTNETGDNISLIQKDVDDLHLTLRVDPTSVTTENRSKKGQVDINYRRDDLEKIDRETVLICLRNSQDHPKVVVTDIEELTGYKISSINIVRKTDLKRYEIFSK